MKTVHTSYRIAIAASLAVAAALASRGVEAATSTRGAVSSPMRAVGFQKIYSAPVQRVIRDSKNFDDFAKAIHQVETQGREGRIYGDGGRSYGPLQISYASWKDAIRFAPSIGGRYADCKSFSYSKKIMLAYLQVHDPESLKNKDWEACARLWNSGPAWQHKRRLTNEYWAQVKTLLVAKMS